MVELKTPPDFETCYVLMCGYENQIKVIIGVLEELQGMLTYDQLHSGGLQKVGERIVGVKTDDYIQDQRNTALNSLEEMISEETSHEAR